MPIQIGRNIRAGLRAIHQEEGIVDYLLGESGGVCALCDTPLNDLVETCAADHIIPEAEGGPTTRDNLQLVHKWCNSVKQNYTNDQIRPYVRFAKRYQIAGAGLNYGQAIDTLDMFDFEPEMCTIRMEEDEAIFGFANGEVEHSRIYHENVGDRDFIFCYTQIPISCIFNDDECQPRSIKYNHIRSLYFDLFDNPLNEPPCCRIQRTTGDNHRILMFDGQHKTMAALLHGREHIVVKIYLDIDANESTKLINTIQNKIVKLKASAFEAMGKLAQEFQVDYARYADEAGDLASEAGFIEFVDAARRTRAKEACWSAIVSEFMDLQSEEMMGWVRLEGRPPLNAERYPYHLTETIWKNKLSQGLLKKSLLTDVGEIGIRRRVNERNNATRAVNYWISAVTAMSGDNDTFSEADLRRMHRNFRQTSIKFSMSMIKKIFAQIQAHEVETALLVSTPSEENWARIAQAISNLVNHPAWTTHQEYSAPAAELHEACQLNTSINDIMQSVQLNLNYCIVGNLPDNVMQIQGN